MPSLGSLGDRVRSLRLSRRLSQAQLAGPGLSDSYISLIESGKRTPTTVVARLLAERLGCTTEYLLHGVEPRQRIDAELGLRHAELELFNGNPATAEERFAEIVKTSADDSAAITALAKLGHARALERRGRIGEAVQEYEQLRREAVDHPERLAELPIVIALCRCYRRAGDLMRARELGTAALAQMERLELVYGQDAVDLGVALIAVASDLGEHSVPFAERVLAATPNVHGVAVDVKIGRLWNASLQAAESEDPALAVRLADEALSAGAYSRVTEGLAQIALGLGELALRAEPAVVDRVPAFIRTAQRAFTRPADKARCLIVLARVEVARSESAQAVSLANEAIALLNGSERVETVSAHIVLGLAHLVGAGPDKAAARSELTSAAQLLNQVPPSREAAKAWRELGDLFGQTGNHEAMVAAYRSALRSIGLRPSSPEISTAPTQAVPTG
ncbi:helix-turn-helix domain-containing protein [Rhizohabitans arisaemae]|uniref:helix-turn-helix domain-containing protein n=1 Tax=Rhizohabitans arisaemae TaxID=2720610 RepID=UPI0024B2067A|nr:helix-turn-helix domain-containing protein [Rhizohabitans arisaemae]